MRIQAVFFDLGETLINEAEIYGTWADWIGVPRHTFTAVLGSVIERGDSHMAVFEHFRPDFDLAVEERRREEAGIPNAWDESDLYQDARPTLAALKGQGLMVGLAGNQPKEAYDHVAAMDLGVDVIGISELWGVEKPSWEFFERVVAEAGCPKETVLYVGDRIDNDVRPGLAFGVQVAHLRRGPWGHVQRDPEAVARCTFRLDDLTSLPDLIAEHNAAIP